MSRETAVAAAYEPHAPLPADWKVESDPSAAIAHAVPHHVVPQLLRCVLSAPLAPLDVALRTIHDAACCTTVVKTHAAAQQAHLLPLVDTVKLGSAIPPEAMAAVGRIPQLTTLSIVWCSEEKVTVSIGQMTKLKSLTLTACRAVDADALRPIAALRDLTTLDLGYNDGVDAEGLSHLVSELRSLTTLSVAACPSIDSAAAALIARWDSLTDLNLGRTPVDTSAMEHISVLSKLERLNIEDCRNVTAEGIVHIAKLKRLRELSLSTEASADDLLPPIVALTDLHTLNLTHCGGIRPDTITNVLARLPRLTALDLTYYRANLYVGNFEMSRLLAAMPALTRLEQLSLANTSVVADGLAHVGRITSLTKLSVRGSRYVDADGIAHLTSLKQLRSLDLSQCERIDATAVSLLVKQTASGMRHLREIDLRSCPKIDAAAIEELRRTSAMRGQVRVLLGRVPSYC